MKIKVTQEDIENGTPTESDQCPIALAIRRDLKFKCQVDESYIVVFNNKLSIYDAMEFKTPEVCKNFIKMFDAGVEVSPFEFEL